MGLDQYAEDPRFGSLESMAAHADLAYGLVHDAIAVLSFGRVQENPEQGHRTVGSGSGCLGDG
jgi:hypothetical protein